MTAPRIAWLLAVALPQPVLAQSVVPKAERLISPTVREAGTNIEEAGEVRLKLPVAEPAGWTLTVSVNDEDIVIDPETIAAYRVYGETIELPARSGGRVELAATGNLREVILESVVLRPAGKPLFPQGGLLERMDPGFRAAPANAAVAAWSNAVVRVRWASPSYATRWCTGVQIAQGRILTNRHCLPAEYSLAAPTGQLAVMFGDFAASLSDVAETLPADVIYLPAGLPGPSGAYQRDVAAIRLKAAPTNPLFRNATLPLADTVVAGRPLALVTIWSADEPQGKAVSRDKIKCSAGGAQEAGWWCFGDATFWHRCEAEEGSSGSPIIDQATGALVGLHYSGVGLNVGNCALRSDFIRQELATLREGS